MKFHKPLSALLLLFTLTLHAGDGERNSPTNNILADIFNFNFEEAEKKLKNEPINSCEQAFLLIELNWWKAIEQGGHHNLKQFYENIRHRKENAAIDSNSYMDLITHTYILRYHMAVKNYPAAAFDYFRIKKIINTHTPPENTDNLPAHLFALYTNLIELAELSYNFSPLKNEASINKQKENQVQQIQQHAACEDFIRSTLGHYFLYKYYNDLSEDDRQSEYHRMVLHDRFPDNPFFATQEEGFNQIITKNMK